MIQGYQIHHSNKIWVKDNIIQGTWTTKIQDMLMVKSQVFDLIGINTSQV